MRFLSLFRSKKRIFYTFSSNFLKQYMGHGLIRFCFDRTSSELGRIPIFDILGQLFYEEDRLAGNFFLLRRHSLGKVAIA